MHPKLHDLISPEYRALLKVMRSEHPEWGSYGYKHAAEVRKLARAVGARSILDYGAGTGSLAGELLEFSALAYDPASDASLLPGELLPYDVVACTDVLEHVEPDKIDAVLAHIVSLANSAVYFTIATREAQAVLPDGRNAHLIVEDADWWREKIGKLRPHWIMSAFARCLPAEGYEITIKLIRPGITAYAYELACFYTDLGRPYQPLIETMTASAKRIMPSCKLTLLTPTPTKDLAALFDECVHLKIDSTWRTICYDKSRAIMTWQLKSERPVVYIDPDLEFKRPLEFPDETVGLLRCTRKTAHPINTGMMFARPGGHEFWQKYGNIVASLPAQLHGWYADQIGFGIMLGSLHKAGDVIQAYDASVKLLPWDEVCCEPERAKDNVQAVHFKGIRKGDHFAPYFGKKKEAA